MAIRRTTAPPRIMPHGNQIPTVSKGKAPLYPARNKPVGPVVSPQAAEIAKLRAYYAKNGHIPTMLANTSRKYFGTANAADVSELGREVAEGHMSLAQAQSIARQGTASLDPIAKRAGLAADTQITPQETALQTQAQLGQDAWNRADHIGSLQNARTVDEQKQIYGRLHDQLASQMPVENAIYDTGAKGIDSAYAGLQQALGSNYGGAIQGTNDEAARLGLQAAAPDSTKQLTGDQQFLQGVAGIQHSGEQGTLTNQRSSSLADALTAMQQSATEGTALTGNTLRDYARTSADSRFQQGQQTAALQQQAAALEGTRKGQVYENTANLQQNAYQQQYQAQQDALQYQLQKEKADAQSTIAGAHVTTANADSQYKLGQLGVAQFDAMTKRQAAAATAGLDSTRQQEILNKMTPGTLAYQQIQAQIAKDQATGDAATAGAGAALSNAATNKYRAEHPTSSVPKSNLSISAGILSGLGGMSVPAQQTVNHAYAQNPPSRDPTINHDNFQTALQLARSVAEKQVAGMSDRVAAQTYLNTIDRGVAAAYGF